MTAKPDPSIDCSSQVDGRRTACFALEFVKTQRRVKFVELDSQCERPNGASCAGVVEGRVLCPFVSVVTVCHAYDVEHSEDNRPRPCSLIVCVAPAFSGCVLCGL